MELSNSEKSIIISLLKKADGEDVDEIIDASNFSYYILHSLMMRSSWNDIDYILKEKRDLFPISKPINQ